MTSEDIRKEHKRLNEYFRNHDNDNHWGLWLHLAYLRGESSEKPPIVYLDSAGTQQARAAAPGPRASEKSTKGDPDKANHLAKYTKGRFFAVCAPNFRRNVCESNASFPRVFQCRKTRSSH